MEVRAGRREPRGGTMKARSDLKGPDEGRKAGDGKALWPRRSCIETKVLEVRAGRREPREAQ